MPTYAVVDDNTVVDVVTLSSEDDVQKLARSHQSVIDTTEYTVQPAVGWVLVDNRLVSNGVIQSMRITKLAFRQRFTFAELCAIQAASKTNIYVDVLMENLNVSTFVDLTRPDNASAMALLVSLGLITSERAQEILTTIPTQLELFKG